MRIEDKIKAECELCDALELVAAASIIIEDVGDIGEGVSKILDLAARKMQIISDIYQEDDQGPDPEGPEDEFDGATVVIFDDQEDASEEIPNKCSNCPGQCITTQEVD